LFEVVRDIFLSAIHPNKGLRFEENHSAYDSATGTKKYQRLALQTLVVSTLVNSVNRSLGYEWQLAAVSQSLDYWASCSTNPDLDGLFFDSVSQIVC
jgi:hypothetical protein